MKKIILALLLTSTIVFASCSPIAYETQQIKSVVSIPEHQETVKDENGLDMVVTVPLRTEEHVETVKVAKVDPRWESTIKTISSVNAFNPTPFAPLVDLGLGALAGVLGLVVNAKNRKVKTLENVAQAVIEGVEAANNDDVKAKIKETAKSLSVEGDLYNLVQKHT